MQIICGMFVVRFWWIEIVKTLAWPHYYDNKIIIIIIMISDQREFNDDFWFNEFEHKPFNSDTLLNTNT